MWIVNFIEQCKDCLLKKSIVIEVERTMDEKGKVKERKPIKVTLPEGKIEDIFRAVN
jgi:hypothetical protein